VRLLDKDDFQRFLKKGGRAQRAVDRTVVKVEEFERYLREERGGKQLGVADQKDLEAFVSSIEKEGDMTVKKYLWSIHYYYEYASHEQMSNLASYMLNEIMSNQAPLKLKEFRGVGLEYVNKLEAIGIRNAKEMIDAGRTRNGRQELAAKSGVPIGTILELVKLSDLARIQGVKGIRARLYHDAGVDTIEKLAEWEPQELITMLNRFVKETRFNGIAPLPKEAKNTVEMAKRLPRVVEY
jgi:hypothetical protein